MHAEMLLVLLAALFVSQIVLILWKQKHPRSYNVSVKCDASLRKSGGVQLSVKFSVTQSNCLHVILFRLGNLVVHKLKSEVIFASLCYLRLFRSQYKVQCTIITYKYN